MNKQQDNCDKMSHQSKKVKCRAPECGWKEEENEAEIIHSFLDGFIRVCPNCKDLKNGKWNQVETYET